MKSLLTSRKEAKRIIVELGFHHSHGYFIKDGDGNHRILVGRRILSLTKYSNYFKSGDTIKLVDTTPEMLKEKILEYFRVDSNEEEWKSIFEKQAGEDGANYSMLKEYLMKNYFAPIKKFPTKNNLLYGQKDFIQPDNKES